MRDDPDRLQVQVELPDKDVVGFTSGSIRVLIQEVAGRVGNVGSHRDRVRPARRERGAVADLDGVPLGAGHDESGGRQVGVHVQAPQEAGTVSRPVVVPRVAQVDVVKRVPRAWIVDVDVRPIAGLGDGPAVMEGVAQQGIVVARGEDDRVLGRAPGSEITVDRDPPALIDLEHGAGIDGDLGIGRDRLG